MKVLGVIPARFASSRLPGKPLADLCGKPLIQRVYENALKCSEIDKLIVATDDERIVQCVNDFGGNSEMTPSELPSGTDRVAFVAKQYNYDIVVNIQGDEPFLESNVIGGAINTLVQNKNYNISTAAKVGLNEYELNSPNDVKVILNKYNEAIYFSRQNIPFIRDVENNNIKTPALKHIGLYVFRYSFLMEFIKMKPTTLEKLEKLEQLRIIENGHKIYVEKTYKDSFGIDTPEDLKKARGMIINE